MIELLPFATFCYENLLFGRGWFFYYVYPKSLNLGLYMTNSFELSSEDSLDLWFASLYLLIERVAWWFDYYLFDSCCGLVLVIEFSLFTLRVEYIS